MWGAPSLQQPIRGYAVHVQPVSSEVKCRRVVLPVPSDLSQGSEGSYLLIGLKKEKNPELNSVKRKIKPVHLPTGSPEPSDLTKDTSYVGKTSHLSDKKMLPDTYRHRPC